jgi:hypothetical protein
MKKLLIFLIILFALASNVVWSADFQKGLDAYRDGDYATALRELRPFAEQGEDDAQFFLGVMYDEGLGVPENDKIAVKWYRLSAEQGDVDSQFNLGQMYRLGEGVPQDYKTALKWYRLSAEQGSDAAQVNMGQMYDQGLGGVSQDYKTSAKWYKLAAEQGNVVAQYNLGLSYYYGEGVLLDYVYAYMWTNISASNGKANGSKARDIIAKEMTSADISKAQKLARECVAKNYKGC